MGHQPGIHNPGSNILRRRARTALQSPDSRPQSHRATRLGANPKARWGGICPKWSRITRDTTTERRITDAFILCALRRVHTEPLSLTADSHPEAVSGCGAVNQSISRKGNSVATNRCTATSTTIGMFTGEAKYQPKRCPNTAVVFDGLLGHCSHHRAAFAQLSRRSI
jgi:hypothetical protein